MSFRPQTQPTTSTSSSFDQHIDYRHSSKTTSPTNSLTHAHTRNSQKAHSSFFPYTSEWNRTEVALSFLSGITLGKLDLSTPPPNEELNIANHFGNYIILIHTNIKKNMIKKNMFFYCVL